MNSQNVRKILTIPVELEKIAKRKMQKRGINSFQTYIQYLVLKDTEDVIEVENVKVGPQFIKDVLEADKMSAEGKLPRSRNEKEMREILEAALKDDSI